MKIGYISDLHREMDSTLIDVPENIDIVILAGDIHVRPKSIKDYFSRLRSKTNAYILYVLGNHEYYGHVHPDILENYRNQACKVNGVFVLEKDSTIINGVRFLGTTLWSDLSDPIHAMAVQNGLNDFYMIKVPRTKLNGKIKYRRMRAEDYHQRFEECRDWLKEKLENPVPKTDDVVITHHSPSPITCDSQYMYSRIRRAFHSNLSDMVIDIGPKLWIYGHDHVSGEHKLGNTRLVSNQHGYPHEGNKKPTLKVIEVTE